MASESDGADVWSLSASADDYASSRPQIQVLNVETRKERVSSCITISHVSIIELTLTVP